MHSYSLRVTVVLSLNLMLAYAQLDNFFLSESMEPTLNDQMNSDFFTSSLPAFAPDQINQGATDLFPGAIDLAPSTDLLDLASLPDPCGSEESLSNDLLQARDEEACTSRGGQVDLPIELFEDPEGYLRDNLPTPPVGQADPFGQESKDDGDLGFGAFMRNRNQPAPNLFDDGDDQLCDRRTFGLSTTPMCSNPYTGLVSRDLSTMNSYTLLDAVPCRSLFRFFDSDSYLS